ncbi:MAG: adenylate/guanylate cyclase domain-containing protein [Hyphomicrobiales bacterium]|nr:adenylate/guanylate cyclase domain-containing protein [Hyphomicrobiales bacterium]
MAVYAGLLSLALLFLAASFGAPLFDRLSSLVFDEYQRFKPRPPADAPILVVDIDEAAIDEIGQWPWPRSQLAILVDRLGELGAAVIAFDIAFSEPDRTSLRQTLSDLRSAGAEIRFPDGVPELDNDAIFTRILERNSTVTGLALTGEIISDLPEPKAGFAYGGRDPKDILPAYRGGLVNLEPFDEAATGLGFFSFPPEVDGVVRKIPLIASANGKLYPSLGIEALRVAQQASNFIVTSTGASGEAEAGAPAIISVRIGAFDAPTDGTGRLWLYYSGNAAANTISASALLSESIDRSSLEHRIAGHIVLIGTSALGLRDLVVTPLGAGVPGVTVHAELIDQILSGTFLQRPDYMPGLEYFVAVVVTILLIAFVRPGQPFVSAIMALALLACIFAVSWYFFVVRQVLVDPLLPALATVLVFIAVTIAQYLSSEREKRFIRNAFGRYLAPAMVNRLSDDPKSLKLGGEMRELTLLFCDIRGFTSLSEELDPEGLTRLLNDFLTPMTDELLKSGATIDKYMGDAIMAFWNAPLSVPDHRQSAMKAALAMMRRLHALNAEKGIQIKIGIGLNTGPCCVGNLGSSQRFNYSAIGDAVNVAARIEGVTKKYGLPVLLEDSVLENGAGDIEDDVVLEVDSVRVVGREEPLVLHTVFDRKELNGSSCAELVDAQSVFLANYRSGNFEAAAAQAKSLKDKAPALLGELYQTYLNRLEILAKAPPENWDGVHQFDEK